MKFSNVVEVLEDIFVGGGVCSLSNWLNDISLLAWGKELFSSKPKDKVYLMHSGNWIFTTKA